MAELFTMIVLAANIIAAPVFAKFGPMAAADAATADEQSSDADTFEGRVAAKIRVRNVRSAVPRDIGESTFWRSPLFLRPAEVSFAMVFNGLPRCHRPPITALRAGTTCPK